MSRTWSLGAVADEMKAAQDQCRQIKSLTERLSGFDNAAAYEVARLIHFVTTAAAALHDQGGGQGGTARRRFSGCLSLQTLGPSAQARTRNAGAATSALQAQAAVDRGGRHQGLSR